jgi:CheY-like chemotaxis protein
MRVEEKQRVGASADEVAVRWTGYGHVLVVDDEPNARLMFRTALETAGFTVDEAEDGAAALQHLAQAACDVVVLDLKMPGIGGMEVLRSLREDRNDVPVVIITAHGSIPDAVEAMKLGAIDFLSKPVTPEELRRVTSEVVARHRDDDRPGEPVRPAAPRSLLSSAKRALGHRLFHRAGALLYEAMREEPGSPEPRYLLGVLREVEGKPRAAAEAYRDALRVDPRYEPAKIHLMKFEGTKGRTHREEADR